ncbi:hypothetical protein HPB49_010995 [Dermacentor silvarum]|uniref:Uncharacterized protein n=1 Tax=Dermacentor silvarum TaxID=543639 RepID=A0ACB8D4V6_DERSI|nr:hypothetical protein HPB49_010995 [Dermacentor silvarum]
MQRHSRTRRRPPAPDHWQLQQPFRWLGLHHVQLRQLPPVRASEVYKCSKTRNIFNTYITWHHLSYFPLVQVVRQSDAIFSAALSKIGDGRALEKEEVDMFQARLVSEHDAKCRSPHAVRLFYSNKDAEARG